MHTHLPFRLKRQAASPEPTHQNTNTPKKAFESRLRCYLPISLKMGEKWTNWHRAAVTPNHRTPPTPQNGLHLKFLGCWQSDASVWRSFLKAPPLTPSRQCRPCVCARECVSYSFQAVLGFTGVWTAGRGALIGQNDAEMDRKPPLEFLKLIFSRPHFYTLTPFQSLTPPHPPILPSSSFFFP